MYCCGITVYDYCHLGHARTCIVWDTVRNYLNWCGYEVNYIQNFTDIDDKILKRAIVEDSSMEAVTEKYIAAYFEDMARLNVSEANAYPRATHTLDAIKQFIVDLEAQGFAYAAEGDVYFSVRRFEEYGKLSGRKLEDLQAGASGRVNSIEDAEPKKQDPFDFALWKAAKPSEPSWDSPWGPGRPGWHIECSAMVRERLGDTIDIHAGGSDLIFPHHENEIAQSEACTGKTLANYWMHNGMVKVDGEKMSKSLGNFITIRQLLEKYEPMAVRLFVLQAQYRKPLDFTDEALQSATNGWQTLKDGLLVGSNFHWSAEGEVDSAITEKFRGAVDSDFNFPAGLAVLFEIAKDLRKEKNLQVHQGQTSRDLATLESDWRSLVILADVLGLVAEPKAETETDGERLSDEAIEALITERAAARKAKNYAASDRVRDELVAQGIVLIDQPDGATQWRRS